MKPPAILMGLVIGAAVVCSHAGGADPVVPGFSVEPYAAAAWPAWMSFDRQAGVLYTGVEAGSPVRIWRIAAGGAPVEEYGADPILDPDAVLHDAAGFVADPGAVLVGGRSGGLPEIWAILPDPAQTVVGVFGPSNEWTNISDMEFDSSGRLLFGDENGTTGRVLAAEPGQAPAELFPVNGRVAALEVDAADRIYTSTFDGRVMIHAADGSVVADPFLEGLGDRILPIAIGKGGPWGTDLYTVNQHSGELIRADMTADTTVVGVGFDGFLADFEFGPDGALYVSDLLGTIWRIAPEASTAIGGPDGGRAQPRLVISHASPVRPPTAVTFGLPRAGRALLRVYDVRGRAVRTLIDGVIGAGDHAARWDGRDSAGHPVPAGIYFYRLEAGSEMRASRVLLLH